MFKHKKTNLFTLKKQKQNLVLKASNSNNYAWPTEPNNENIVNEIVDSFIDWVLNSKLSKKKKRNIQSDRTKLLLGKPFLISFIKTSYEKGTLQQLGSFSTEEELSNINWATFTFSKLYNLYIDNLKSIENNRPDYLPNRKMFCIHHIQPRFENGDNSPSNIVLLHYHEHSWVHLIRWLYTDSHRDLGGFTSNMRTIKSVVYQREQRALNVPNSPNPPRPQAGRKKPAVTARVIQNSRKLGATYQTYSRVRVNPLTWFVSTSTVCFKHTSGVSYLHVPSPDIFDIKNTASDIARNLVNIAYSPPLVKNPQNLSMILCGKDKTRGGWSIAYVQVGTEKITIAELKQLFNKILKNFENNQELALQELLSWLLTNNIISIANEFKMAETILDFLFKRKNFLDPLKIKSKS